MSQFTTRCPASTAEKTAAEPPLSVLIVAETAQIRQQYSAETSTMFPVLRSGVGRNVNRPSAYRVLASAAGARAAGDASCGWAAPANAAILPGLCADVIRSPAFRGQLPLERPEC